MLKMSKMARKLIRICYEFLNTPPSVDGWLSGWSSVYEEPHRRQWKYINIIGY